MFDSSKIYVLPDYNYNKLIDEKIYCFTTNLTFLTDKDFRQSVKKQKEDFSCQQELVITRDEL
jgi:hypothetical protein